jgi:hypothetical protein
MWGAPANDGTDTSVRLLRRTSRNVEANTPALRAAEIRQKSGRASSIPVGSGTQLSRIEKVEKR